ncbi:lipase family protein [Cellulomonas fimi]|nr:lipase family protein [Cellulomonas fimi]NNH06702.1 lipase [Cellulomonas fimi]
MDAGHAADQHGRAPDEAPDEAQATPPVTAPPVTASRATPGRRWASVVGGAVVAALGAVLALRPFSSLAVLVAVVVTGLVVAGVVDLVASSRAARGTPAGTPAAGARLRPVRGLLFLATAAVVLAWPEVTVRVLALVLAGALVADGALDLLAARAARGSARAEAVLGGVAGLLVGVLAFAWPDVTVLVVAVLFGARLVLLGVRAVVAGVRGSTDPLLRPVRSEPRGGWRRVSGAAAGAALALALALVSVGIHRAAPTPDAFYDPPADVPAEPGRLLRSEPFTSAEIPSGADAWRILYTTTRDEDVPAVASGLVVVPTHADGPVPVVAWAHGTTGTASGCAPSVLDDGLAAGAMFVQDDVLAAGWALVATDYVGLGTEGPHPYLVGQAEGRSVLDAVRAARELDVGLADRTVVWGHSQGGHAALWTGVLAPGYAPDVPLDGVAALAPAADLPALVENLATVPGGAMFAAYAIDAYTTLYPDVAFEEYVRPGARLLVRETASRCLAEPGVVVSLGTSLVLDKPLWHGDPTRGAFQERLLENVPSGPVDAPVLVAQGAADGLVLPAAQAGYVRARCAAGYAVDYRLYDGRTHVALVEADSPLVPDLLAWTTDRFADDPAADTCASVPGR